MQVANRFDGPSGVDNVILNLPNHISEAMMTMMENIDSINSKVSHVTLTFSDLGASRLTIFTSLYFKTNSQGGCEFDFQISGWLGRFHVVILFSLFSDRGLFGYPCSLLQFRGLHIKLLGNCGLCECGWLFLSLCGPAMNWWLVLDVTSPSPQERRTKQQLRVQHKH